ncbi:DNA primase noncatalytic subunit PriX [Candidatus Nitrosocosmicus hydrocola]|uniref:DNA primase noncatalytic subunit PriX n=1 Tax=Candidatus Nitrosocosmicus hydrocola TaxID=1826872 RepID=UPI00137242DC|nr:DNA primase noncatalytic subunit PriX [Candidatus Nitrosocosmicus hydrocola]
MKTEDVEFILSHFQNQTGMFPRKMMTHISKGQFSIYSKEEVLERCKQSHFIDCRINAYPELTDFKGIVRQSPDIVFIDLDLGDFNHHMKKLDLALKNTLIKIKKFQGCPSVLWTGKGYHIYLPISAIVLDQESIFSKDNFLHLFSIMSKYSNWSVSEVFLKFVEIFFTNGKADPLHKPKYKSSLLRIPGSYNSKLLNQSIDKEESRVKIVERWNGRRIPIQYLLKYFRRWIVQEEVNQRIIDQRRKNFRSKTRLSTSYSWVENLLQTPLEDHRKYCLVHILAPYLVNVKRLSQEESSELVLPWLSKCNTVRSLDFNPSTEIKNRLRYVGDFRPISLAKLKNDNLDLYRSLNNPIDLHW